ncbi:MAG: hypothetical protein JWR23_2179 [Mucilaginibacter sp.]|nr:hypothetical protein [Mucilaginibacter sp.]
MKKCCPNKQGEHPCFLAFHIHHLREGSLRRDKKSRLHKRAGIVRFSAAPPGLDYLPGYALLVAQLVNMGCCIQSFIEISPHNEQSNICEL